MSLFRNTSQVKCVLDEMGIFFAGDFCFCVGENSTRTLGVGFYRRKGKRGWPAGTGDCGDCQAMVSCFLSSFLVFCAVKVIVSINANQNLEAHLSCLYDLMSCS